MIIEYKGIKLRFVETDDASFIVSIRNNEKKSRFISKTSPDVDAQKQWIQSYKEREQQQKEYYFIAFDENNEDFATYRVYKIDSGLPEIGSWVSKPEYSNVKNSVKVDMAVKDFVLNELNFDSIQFEVRKQNTSVNSYHKMFKPELIRSDDENNYYLLTKDTFNTVIPDILKKFKI
ncbi:GNAT family N-acetyltransferase [Chryseobacterium sp. OV279]|uniref:GNAT family N-acetyltransferase n=1 Tax=Chryseobacterium sp. OV279 TaxID=1500285 RepID=UPI000646F0C8|nr:GNAT family N-acetyltransferase [Chryseobacterium sp. OV279]SHG40534.1 Acetyltransferase (GNAT) domain-containing protein [Chryseobacterium sp. OV279]